MIENAINLRPYQQNALASTLEALRHGLHPVIAHPTGAGKGVLCGALCVALEGRIAVLSHRQELLIQNAEKLLKLTQNESIGIYSAGLEQRDTSQRIIFGGVQSVYHRMDMLQRHGNFNYIIVDECHLVAPKSNEAAMYAQCFAACPTAQRIGLSATPWRLSEGPVYGENGQYFDVLAHHVGIRELTPTYLSPLRGVLTAHDMPVDGVRIRQGDFLTSDLSQIACEESLVEATLDELCFLAKKRTRWLIYTVDLVHASLVADRLAKRGIATGLLTGKTEKKVERPRLLRAIAEGSIQALVNCEVAECGFDIAPIDCICLMRPSQSKGKIVQFLGRGTRQAEFKKDCLVLDFAGNIERHAPLDAIHDIHLSPERVKLNEEREAKKRQQRQLAHDTRASDLDPMGEDAPALTIPVASVYYDVALSRNPAQPGRSMLKVLYHLKHAIHKWVTQWVCLEYTGGARFHAERWFARRQKPMPPTAAEAMARGERGEYPKPEAVVVKQEGKWLRIVMEHFRTEKDEA